MTYKKCPQYCNKQPARILHLSLDLCFALKQNKIAHLKSQLTYRYLAV